MKKIAIIGAKGLLGTELVSVGQERSLPIIRCAHTTDDLRNYALIDITNPSSIDFFLDQWRPDVILNCAAYTKVDDAEDNYSACFSLNSVAPELLARACKNRNIFLVHVSTDYVFGGEALVHDEQIPFSENNRCSPCGIYGWSKYFGEKAVTSLLPDASLVVRTSWLHGTTGPNFIKTIVRVAKEKGELKVVNDQFGSLTFAPWLAGILYDLVDSGVTGIIHASAHDTTTWFDVAKTVLEKAQIDCRLSPQTTEESGRKAPRPRYSKMDVTALSRILNREIPSNLDFINAYLSQVQ